MTPSELLARMAVTLKTEVGPAIDAEYPRGQAFLSAVVLGKLARQLRLHDAHRALELRDREALERDLAKILAEIDLPASVREAFVSLPPDDDGALCRFIETLYGAREKLGEALFETMLGRVRQYMRRSLDRRMEYAS